MAFCLKGTRFFFGVVIAVVLCQSVDAKATAESTAEDAIRQMTDLLLKQLRPYQGARDSRVEVDAILQETLRQHIDFELIAHWLVGDDWMRGTAEQQQVFIREFSSLIARSYAVGIVENIDSEVTYLGEQPLTKNGNIVLVKTAITPAKSATTAKQIPVNYRLRRKKTSDNTWRIIDVLVDGVSLVQVYRGDIRSVMNKAADGDDDPLDHVIRYLKTQRSSPDIEKNLVHSNNE